MSLVICCSTTVNIITLACQFKRIITPVAAYRYNIQMSGDTNNLITLAHLCITTVIVQIDCFKSKLLCYLKTFFQCLGRTFSKGLILGVSDKL